MDSAAGGLWPVKGGRDQRALPPRYERRRERKVIRGCGGVTRLLKRLRGVRGGCAFAKEVLRTGLVVAVGQAKMRKNGRTLGITWKRHAAAGGLRRVDVNV